MEALQRKKYLNSIFDNIGNTPMLNFELESNNNVNAFLKLEMYNPTGSIKDRAAFYIIEQLFKKNVINENTIIIESSSGNFGISLAAICKLYNLKFICVVDPNITRVNEILIKLYGGIIDKVNTLDETGGFLLTRINRVKELITQYENIYWINQYENTLNAEAYKNTLGKDICKAVNPIDYVFIGVSSCGTITGVSQKVKEEYPNSKVIAVDIEGSIIFGGKAKKRFIPGIGSSKRPQILDNALIDDIIIVNEQQTINMCYFLLEKYNICCGGSSGSVFYALNKYFINKELNNKINAVTILADHGERYLDTIYNSEWHTKIQTQ